jgi:hypothetical protein
MRRAVCAGVLGLLAGAAAAADYRAGAEDYRDYLRRLQPGDRLLLEPGDYRQGLPLNDLSGRDGQPIVIEAADPAALPRFLARPGANTVSLVDVRHLVLRRLELDGRNLPVDAVKAEGHGHFADFVTLEQLYIHDHAASQQNVGISTKCPAFGWRVRGNRIERVGTGMYFGDSDGSDPFVAGVIEDNRVSATLGYNLQIKHQTSRPTDMPEPDRQHDTLIRRNEFSRDGAVSGPYPRPNVLLGHFPVGGAGSADRYLVYNNRFIQNPDEALLQAEGNLVIFGNLFVNRHGDALHIQPHNDVPRTVYVFNNTVIAAGEGISLRNRELPAWPQKVFANAVFAGVPLTGGEAAGNLLGRYGEAPRFLRAPYADPAPSPRRAMRYRDIWPWPSLPAPPTGLDGRPLVPGEIGALSAVAGARRKGPRAQP